MALHHFLLSWAMTEAGEWPFYAPPLAEPRYARIELDPEEADTWADAVAAYADAADRNPVFDRGLIAVRDHLAGVPGSTVPEGDTRLVEAVEAALPVYLRHWWPEHDHANRAWIEALVPTLRAVEEEGEIARMALESRGQADYDHYGAATGVYSRGERWTAALPAFEASWRPFLAGTSEDPAARRAALEALARQLVGGGVP